MQYCSVLKNRNIYLNREVIFASQRANNDPSYEAFVLEATANCQINRIGGVMVSVLASSAVDRGFEPCSGQTKDNDIGICRFSIKHSALWRKSKDWLARNQDNLSVCGYLSIRGLLHQ